MTTWYRPNGTARSRLDRILVSDLWIETWPGSTQYILSRSVSDHCALVIKNRIIDWGPKPFRALDVWFEVDGYKDVIKQAWDREVNSGHGMEITKIKLKGLKQVLKLWREQVVNSKKVRKQKILDEIDELNQKDDEGSLREVMRVRRVGLLGELKTMTEKDIVMMKQKSR